MAWTLPSAAGARRSIADVLGLVLPVECPGCGRWDVALCGECAALFDGPPWRCEDAVPALALPVLAVPFLAGPRAAGTAHPAVLPVWTLAPYAGAVRGTVLAWKNRGGRRLAEAIADAGRRAGTAWATALVGDGPDRGAAFVRDATVVRGAAIVRGTTVAVLPAPSGRRRRLAGRLVVADLAVAVARGLADSGVFSRVVVADVLRRRSGRTHQAGLGLAGRSRNRRRSMRLTAPPPPGAVCLLVDDVVTTGSTLAECRRVLAAAGRPAAGALVLAATPAPGRRT